MTSSAQQSVFKLRQQTLNCHHFFQRIHDKYISLFCNEFLNNNFLIVLIVLYDDPFAFPETADTIYSSLFKVRSIEGFNDFDLKGLANAQVPMAHFDLDGMSSNPLMVNHRIAMLKREK